MNKLRRMEIFKAVVDAGQFARAAQNLRLSNSAVSHAISDLEDFLGVQLLSRNTRGFQLTDDGERYYQNCCHILSEINAVENDLRQTSIEVDGPISITAPISYGVNIISPILAKFLQSNPNIDLSVSLSENYVDLVQAGIDMAIRIGRLPNSAMTAQKISTVKLILCASPDFTARHPDLKSLEDLNTVNCFRYRWTPKWNFTHEGSPIIFSPKGSVTSDSGDALLEFVAAGLGVSFLPDFICDDALKKGRIVSILPEYIPETVPVHAVFPPNKQRPVRLQKLLEFLKESFA